MEVMKSAARALLPANEKVEPAKKLGYPKHIAAVWGYQNGVEKAGQMFADWEEVAEELMIWADKGREGDLQSVHFFEFTRKGWEPALTAREIFDGLVELAKLREEAQDGTK